MAKKRLAPYLDKLDFLAVGEDQVVFDKAFV
jgi:hypothetical protein